MISYTKRTKKIPIDQSKLQRKVRLKLSYIILTLIPWPVISLWRKPIDESKSAIFGRRCTMTFRTMSRHAMSAKEEGRIAVLSLYTPLRLDNLSIDWAWI